MTFTTEKPARDREGILGVGRRPFDEEEWEGVGGRRPECPALRRRMPPKEPPVGDVSAEGLL